MQSLQCRREDLTQSVVAPANGATMFYQILVQGTDVGLVNINNITVDGSINQVGVHFGGSWESGIYYQNSSGAVNRVAVRNQSGSGFGFGIFLESTTASLKKFTIANCSVHAFDAEAIRANENTLPKSITVDIHGN